MDRTKDEDGRAAASLQTGQCKNVHSTSELDTGVTTNHTCHPEKRQLCWTSAVAWLIGIGT